MVGGSAVSYAAASRAARSPERGGGRRLRPARCLGSRDARQSPTPATVARARTARGHACWRHRRRRRTLWLVDGDVGEAGEDLGGTARARPRGQQPPVLLEIRRRDPACPLSHSVFVPSTTQHSVDVVAAQSTDECLCPVWSLSAAMLTPQSTRSLELRSDLCPADSRVVTPAPQPTHDHPDHRRSEQRVRAHPRATNAGQ